MKWWFRKQWPAKRDLLVDGIDWHSHILPGVDDGVEDIEETLEILRRYERVGMREVWFTPHIMVDIPNTTESLKKIYSDIVNAYEGSLKLHLAAEYMVDDLFEERLISGDILTFGMDKKHILIETSCFYAPINLTGTINKIKELGYLPVLAHPERYNYMGNDDFIKLKRDEVQFQLNILSLEGFYGKVVRQKARNIYSRGWYNYFGSDLHGEDMLQVLKF